MHKRPCGKMQGLFVWYVTFFYCVSVTLRMLRGFSVL